MDVKNGCIIYLANVYFVGYFTVVVSMYVTRCELSILYFLSSYRSFRFGSFLIPY